MVLSKNCRRRRDGVILVVVVAMLALFAVIGVGYVMYAESAATTARMARDTQTTVTDKADSDPQALLAKALGDIIYDVHDDARGVYNAIRGHGLARTMYGWNYTNANGSTTGFAPQLSANNTNNPNTVPFSGLGKMEFDAGTSANGYGIVTGAATDPLNSGDPTYHGKNIINYVPHRTDSFVIDPERYGINPNTAASTYRQNNSTGIMTPSVSSGSTPLQKYFGGANVPYTYPDNNNVALGAVRASDGQVLTPSFHRPYLFKQWNGSSLNANQIDPTFLANQNHPDWYRPSGRKKLLRPRPVDQLTSAQIQSAIGSATVPENISSTQITQLQNAIGLLIKQGRMLPYPSDAGGDVKNLLGGAGGNDSVWIDTGMPVQTTASGKKYKALVSYLVVDMDGRINLNVAGNFKGAGSTHVSDQGLGRHEISLARVLNADANLSANLNPDISAREWKNLLSNTVNSGMSNQGWSGRYDGPTTGINGIPVGPAYTDPSDSTGSQINNLLAQPYDFVGSTTGRAPDSTYYMPSHYRVNFNGAATARLQAQTYSSSVLYPLALSSFPGYGAGTAVANDVTDDPAAPSPADPRKNHPFLYNSLRHSGSSLAIDGLEMHKLIGRYEDGSREYSDSVLYQMAQTNLANPSIRHMITLASADVGRPGVFANALQPTTASGFKYDPTAPGATLQKSQGIALQGETFPASLKNVLTGVSPTPDTTNDFQGNQFNVFGLADGKFQTNVTANPNSNDGRARIAAALTRVDLNRPLRAYPDLKIDTNGKVYDTAAAQYQATQLPNATADRQAFATDIFSVLREAVGAPKLPQLPTDSPLTAVDYYTLKWLAQLAANIVDYIDEDDVMTQFTWVGSTFLPTGGLLPGDTATDKVYGVEMPKVVINEAYMEVTNGDNTPVTAPTPPSPPVYVWKPSTPVTAQPRAQKFQVNVWAELNNTMVPPSTTADPKFIEKNTEWFVSGATSVYRMHLVPPGTTVHTGDPAAGTVTDSTMLPTPSLKTVDFTSATNQEKSLAPVDTAAGKSFRSNTPTKKNEGFYVIGPKWTGGPPQGTGVFKFDTDPDNSTFKHQAMTWDIDTTVKDPSAADLTPPTLVLQRLADPYQAHHPTNNPYVTVDVMAFPTGKQVGGQAVVNPAIDYSAMASGSPKTKLSSSTLVRKSVGRRQPLAGDNDQTTVKEMVLCPVTSGSPTAAVHTFFSHNASTGPTNPPNALPETVTDGLQRFDWFVHLDRKLTSPLELIHVSAVPPWEVTQKFITKNPDTSNTTQKVLRQGHTAPWTDQVLAIDDANVATMYQGPNGAGGRQPYGPLVQTPTPGTAVPSARLYRALEYFRVGDRTVEMAFGGRDVGKVNINTIWDKAVFDAVFDASMTKSFVNGGNTLHAYDCTQGFTQADVDSAWAMMTTNVIAGTTTNQTARTPFLNTFAPVASATKVAPMIFASTPSSSPPVSYTVPTSANGYSMISDQDRPFWGMGAPHEVTGTQYPNGAGIDNTLLRSIKWTNTSVTDKPARGHLFDAESQFQFTNTVKSGDNTFANPPNTGPAPPDVQHPLLEKSMLSKAFEHFTTRSNVFAVYMTVGFFEVLDDSAKPELLGNEMGVTYDATSGAMVENKATRHRMFAIVDRTNLALQPAYCTTNGTNPNIVAEEQLKQGPAPFYYTATATAPTNQAWQITLPIESSIPLSGQTISATSHYNGMSWKLQPYLRTSNPPAQDGTVIYVGQGSSQSRFVVKKITPNATNTLADIELGIPAPGGTWQDISSNPPPKSPITIYNAIPGNPGPQPDFDPQNPRYQNVVIYSAVLQ